MHDFAEMGIEWALLQDRSVGGNIADPFFDREGMLNGLRRFAPILFRSRSGLRPKLITACASIDVRTCLFAGAPEDRYFYIGGKSYMGN